MLCSGFIISAFKDIRFLCFIFAFALYAFFGSPTPDHPALIELVIALLFLGGIGISNLISGVTVPAFSKVELWQLSAWVFFIYGLFVSIVMALVNGAALILILRDIVGFVFLCLPLFLYPYVQAGGRKRKKAFVISILMIGLIFSLRVLSFEWGDVQTTTKLLYLANSPIVLFTALFLVSLACQKLFNRVSLRSFLFAAGFLGLAAITFAAMSIDLQRASFLALVITLLSLLVIGFIKAPLKTIAPMLVFLILIILAGSLFSDVLQSITLKTSRVGLNMRLQELYAVWDVAQYSWSTLLFGHGWGSSFASPAVGDLHVTYTHSLLTYILLKMGLLGLFLCLVYIFFIFEKLTHLYFTDPVKGNALMWPLLIPIFLYASHKSFDFGLVLTLILIFTSRDQKAHYKRGMA